MPGVSGGVQSTPANPPPLPSLPGEITSEFVRVVTSLEPSPSEPTGRRLPLPSASVNVTGSAGIPVASGNPLCTTVPMILARNVAVSPGNTDGSGNVAETNCAFIAGPTLLKSSVDPPRPRSTAYAVFTPKTRPSPPVSARHPALANCVNRLEPAVLDPITTVSKLVPQLCCDGSVRTKASLTLTSGCAGSFGPDEKSCAYFSRGSSLS